MEMPASSTRQPASVGERLTAARRIMQGEADAISQIASELDQDFLKVVDAICECSGQVVISGMGKAGLIGQKISATFASTGTRSIFLHPAEAVHGDLGRVHGNDVMLLLSYSGETEELNRLLPVLRTQTQLLVAMTGARTSTLAKNVDVVLSLGALREMCPLGLAPSTSTTAMLALGDALALSVSEQRGFTREAFARNHPAGNLGKQLSPVEQSMRPLDSCRVAHHQTTLCDVLVRVSKPGRRSGAVMLIDDAQKLVGIFTDSDLARLLEQRRHDSLDQPIANVMTTRFRTVTAGSPLSEAIELLAQFKISELPVVDPHTGVPVGMIDITDVVGLVAHAEKLRAQADPSQRAVADDGQLISVPIPKRTIPRTNHPSN